MARFKKITEYDNICCICGRPAECTHHLVFGFGKRALADQDGLIMPLCNECHNTAQDVKSRIHDNPTAEALSKICGQLVFEKNEIESNNKTGAEARELFRKRYGVSYL